MNDDGLLGFLLILAIPVALVWLFVKLRRTKRERDGLAKDLERLTTLKDALVKERAGLEAENALLRSDNLKIQLEPHTLKNTMAKLQSYASNLSHGMDVMMKTMDYVLYKGGTHKVGVGEEIGFIQSFMDMHQILRRERDGMDVIIDEGAKSSRWYQEPCIPHLITGYLLDNAFKHGDMEHPEFLKVKLGIERNRFRLEVINRIGRTKDKGQGGIGLKNMRERLEVLMDGKAEFEHGPISEQVYRAVLTINFAA